METKVFLPGTEDPNARKDLRLGGFLKVDVKTARTVDAVSRSAGSAGFSPLPASVKPDDIVELEFESDGRKWTQWVTADQLQDDLTRAGKLSVARDGASVLQIPHTWETSEVTRFGVGTVLMKGLKIFGIETPEKFAEKGAKKIAASIADKFESEIENQGHTFGLYRFLDPNTIDGKQLITDAKKLGGAGPCLIFLHGTASSSVGSFGKLAGTKEWKQLQEHYGDRIFALEHRTFSVSPIHNAIDLVNLLPDGARLHLVSHSRGGLVGELLCLGQARDSQGKFDELSADFAGKEDDSDPIKAERRKQRQQLEDLWNALIGKNLTVERFARVACPAHGTTLASRRMDGLASGLLNAIGLIPFISSNPIVEVGYDWAKSLLLTLVKEKADPKELPGIEAMMPDSPLVEFLNHRELGTKADLGIIAGDIEVGSLKMTIPALFANGFFFAQNDLVVNTKAMKEGIRRDQKAWFFFDQGKDVCHFNYFFNQKTREKLLQWLLRADGEVVEGFREVPREAFVSRGGKTVVDWLEKPEEAAGQVQEYELTVTVSHGDLRHAKHPVAVGHYDGDGIISAEKSLDQLLDYRLSKRFDIKLYPGPVGSAAVIYGPDGSSPKGALIVGLGETSDLNAEVVRQGITTAALQYALSVVEQNHGSGGDTPLSAAFSSLLIGTYGGNALRVKDSITAILQGAMNANRILQEQQMWDRVRIDRVEVIEIYEDVAIQAIHAVHELGERLKEGKSEDFAKGVTLNVSPKNLRTPGGGRYQRPVSDHDTYWYGRIQVTAAKDAAARPAQTNAVKLPKLFSLDHDLQITQRFLVDKLIEEAMKSQAKRNQLAEILTGMLAQGDEKPVAGGGLEFLVLTDRARAEASLQVTQRRLVDWMVERAVNDTRYDSNLSVSLFELLIPNELKDRTENVHLLVDREAAQYPWELMTERSRPNEPLATRMGILRQFRTADFRHNPRPSRGSNALVVGDTLNSGLVELFGAQMEAQSVVTELKSNGFNVTSLIKQGGTEVINELFAREYQILHIAAHGTFNLDDPDECGVVLGDGRYLTAKEMVNLRTVPDLVFINCCHLGKMERDEDRKLSFEYPHRLAASVAEEMIKMGVRAVVAAGWAVDDAAATKFATAFYGNLLDGMAFGQAVLQARKETHTQFRFTNTWGAYQCYGNPNFTIRQPGSHQKSKRYYSRREYRDDLKGIAESPDAQNKERNQWLIDRLNGLEETLEIDDEFRDGEVLADFGDAWRVLGDFRKANEFYTEAIDRPDAKAAINAIERLGNLQCRYALQLWRQEKSQPAAFSQKAPAGRKGREQEEETPPQVMLSQAKDRFDWLLSLGETSERHSLLGKVYKCMAIISEGKARETNLRLSRDGYQKGYEIARKTYEQARKEKQKKAKEDFMYPGLNLIACNCLLPGRKTAEIIELIEECEKASRAAASPEAGFWARLWKPDLAVLRHLVKGDLARQKNRILDDYKAAFSTGAKPGDAESVLSQIEFLSTILGGEDRTKLEKDTARILTSLKEELQKLALSLPG